MIAAINPVTATTKHRRMVSYEDPQIKTNTITMIEDRPKEGAKKGISDIRKEDLRQTMIEMNSEGREAFTKNQDLVTLMKKFQMVNHLHRFKQ